jgi:cobyrinic acid a,c-diamide synthase
LTTIPRLVTAALRGGAGKTLITVGLIAALRARGLAVAPFKKGPDYIDAGWLGLAAGGDCFNLDTYLCREEVVARSFVQRSLGKDLAVVEGNRGLFDGVDSRGAYSTAELAKMLGAPVILIVDATKVTRTAAALVLGCIRMEPDLGLKGVILNRVAGARHERILRNSIESATGVPVVGTVSKLAIPNFPQRHLGLLPLHEHPAALTFVEDAARLIGECVDLDKVQSIAGGVGALSSIPPDGEEEHCWTSQQWHPRAGSTATPGAGLRIGIMKDSAFQFYYPENLEALRFRGAELVGVTALEPRELPDLDALYMGGGFPETHADRLAENRVFKESLRDAVNRGLPVYAECGGLMYLSRSLRMDERVYPMVGVFPIDTVMERRPQGLGYIRVRVAGPNPFYPLDAELSGHEFHYSAVADLEASRDLCAFEVIRGHGMDGKVDGICAGNALGTYMHVHALGEPLWVEGILRKAAEFSGRASKERASERLQSR